LHRFTIGQRKGLGVALGTPAFVTRIDPESATVHLGPEAGLSSRGALLVDVVLAKGVVLPRRLRVRVRYRHEGDEGWVQDRGVGRAAVVFDRSVRAVTRGQTAVLYDGDCVLGGGRIAGPLGEGDLAGSLALPLRP
jgi:tRNA-specific 2-thiouridylase